MSTSVYTGLNPFNFIRIRFLQICVRKLAVHLYKRCWKWCPRASIQAWTRLILFANTFCISAFGESLCTYKRCWKWCPRASKQAWVHLILFAHFFCRSAFGESLCTYKRWWKWSFSCTNLRSDFFGLRSIESERVHQLLIVTFRWSPTSFGV
jgi:hypothetical protein